MTRRHAEHPARASQDKAVPRSRLRCIERLAVFRGSLQMPIHSTQQLHHTQTPSTCMIERILLTYACRCASHADHPTTYTHRERERERASQCSRPCRRVITLNSSVIPRRNGTDQQPGKPTGIQHAVGGTREKDAAVPTRVYEEM